MPGPGGGSDRGAQPAGDRPLLPPENSWETKCKTWPWRTPRQLGEEGAAPKRPGANPLPRLHFGRPEPPRAFGSPEQGPALRLCLDCAPRAPGPEASARAGKRPEPLPLPPPGWAPQEGLPTQAKGGTGRGHSSHAKMAKGSPRTGGRDSGWWKDTPSGMGSSEW